MQRLIDAMWQGLDGRFHLTPLIEKNVTKKLVPRTLSWSGCFGGMAFLVFLVQVFTGMLLLIYYKPGAAEAWDSVTFIKSNVPMGWLIQRTHAIGANVMICLVLMHIGRIAYNQIFRAPREFHWMSGALLLLLTTAMAFTGYLLPWTQLSFWGAKVGTEMPSAVPLVGEDLVVWIRRGNTISDETLGFFFSLHIWVIPAVVSVLLLMHFAMIRRTGISRPL
jgi:ubiquinol-cytochrome c reductase cytochrome b subunit